MVWRPYLRSVRRSSAHPLPEVAENTLFPERGRNKQCLIICVTLPLRKKQEEKSHDRNHHVALV